MITIQQLPDNRITLRCHYAYKDRCRQITGAEFNHAHKVWVVPLSSLPEVRAEFYGEIYYKTPLWKLLGHREPEKPDISFLGPAPEIPKLNLKPYGYQEEGIKFMIDRLNNLGFVMNGDAVGLGKTLQAIGTMKWFVENRGARKILIVCKKSIKTQWASEIRKIAGWQKVPIYVTGGTKKKRMDAYAGIQNSRIGILITNYHNFLNDFDEINKTNYDICVIDEAHCIKSRDGKMNKLIGDTVKGKRTILLTGTPIMSRPDDVWGIVRMVSPSYFGTYEEFRDRYIVTDFTIYGEQIIGARDLDDLQEKIRQFLVMRTTDDVELELPKKLPPKVLSCEMDAIQKKMQAIVVDLKNKQDQKKQELVNRYGYTERTKLEINKMNELSKMYIATMQFIADDPAVFRYMDAKKGINVRMQKMLPDAYGMSWKTEATLDTVAEIIDADEKVIVFCHFSSAARMLKDKIGKIPGAKAVLYTGAENDETREQNITAFKSDPEVNVLIGTEAMAEGLNLQVSRYVIHYEQADTYAQREQRIGRISEYKAINIIDVVTEGSFDLAKLNKLERDKLTSDSLLAG